MNAPGAIILFLLIIVVLSGPRRWAFLAMIAGVMFQTQNQQVEVAGLNMDGIRFLELAGFVRVMARREFSFSHLIRIDRALLWLYFYTTVVFLLRSPDGQAYQIGVAVDALLSYFTFRGLLHDMEDFQWFLRALIVLLAPYTLLVLLESITGHNSFGWLGGMDGGALWMRNGRPRCFGSFRQPDTLGMCWASFIPLYLGMAFTNKWRKRALLAIGLCLVVVWTANSGGALSAAGVAFLGWGFWRIRTEMRKVRRAIAAVIAGLAMVMKAPIWFIFMHVSGITGGDGWHRSYLIDVAIRHLNQWWFAGMPISGTFDWLPYQNPGTGAADITNQYLAFGIVAGLGAIVLFIFLLTTAFSFLGQALAAARSGSQRPNENEYLLWGLGVMLVVHVVDWFGITYFDQMYMVWFMQLAAISMLSQACLDRPKAIIFGEDFSAPQIQVSHAAVNPT